MDHATPAPDRKRALFRARKLHAEMVYDAAVFEGVNYTFPEVQTLLDGVTVGGKKIEDQELVLRLAEAHKWLFDRVEQEAFALDRDTACALNALVARGQALEWGVFRSGPVRIAGARGWAPPAAASLNGLWDEAAAAWAAQPDILRRAAAAFLDVARNQFFWDGNKRTGRLLMNGVLLSHGHDAVSIPAARQLEFNEKMLRFYESGDQSEMFALLLDCAGIAPAGAQVSR